MSRQLLSYDDLDHIQITDEQYHSNLIHQYPHLDPALPVGELEFLIDILQVPYELRVTFCRVTKTLPELTQQIIMSHLI
jgi:hypothetical protein